METGYKKSSRIDHVGVDNFQWFGERIMVGRRGAFFMLAVITAAAFHVGGLHGVIAPVVDNKNLVYLLDFLVFGFVVGLEHFRNSLLTKGLDDALKRIVSGTAVKSINFFMFAFITSVLLSLTVLGAFEGVQYYNELKKNSYIVNSLEYKSLKAETDSRVKAEEIHDKRMKEWREDKQAHDADCNAQWSSDFRTMRAKCKENFRHQPKGASEIAVSTEVDSGVIKSLESKYDGIGAWTIVFAVILAVVLDMIAVYPTWEEYYSHRAEILNNAEIATKMRQRETARKESQTRYLDESGRVHAEYFEKFFNYKVVFDQYQAHKKLEDAKRTAIAYQGAMNSPVTDVEPEYQSARPAHVTVPKPNFKKKEVIEEDGDQFIRFVKTIFENGKVKEGGKTLSIRAYAEDGIGEGRTVTDRKSNFTFCASVLVQKGIITSKKGLGYTANMPLEEAIAILS